MDEALRAECIYSLAETWRYWKFTAPECIACHVAVFGFWPLYEERLGLDAEQENS